MINTFLKQFAKDSGSATVEFVMLALPLFIPLFLYLNSYAIQSDLESSMRTIGREMSRAFVIAENDAIAFSSADEVFRASAEVLGYGREADNEDLIYKITCKSSPCISSDNEIRIEVISLSSQRKVTSIGYVSPFA